MNREPIRNPARSVANLEFHTTGDHVNDVCRAVVTTLEREGIAAINPPMGFPMEADRFPEKMWVVSHKPVAVAAGLGMMGIHRNVIHPKFGNFILLGTVLIGLEATEYGQPISYNPCLSCKLCVAACPVGAISPDGHFDLASCYTHNYREFMGGFGDWVEHVADAKSGLDLRKKVTRQETVSTWQSLAFGPNYKAAYCLSVCPAGDDVIGLFKADRKGFLNEVVKPLQEKEETMYVVPKSDAEAHVKKRFPHKTAEDRAGQPAPSDYWRVPERDAAHVPAGAIGGTERHLPLHLHRQGAPDGHGRHPRQDHPGRGRPRGDADLRLTADSETWLGFLAKERSLLWALLRRKIRIKGSPRLLVAFGKCFPS